MRTGNIVKTVLGLIVAITVLMVGTTMADEGLPAGKETKTWPDCRLRGLDMAMYMKTPSGMIDESCFLKLKEWNVNVLRVWISVDKDSPWNVKRGQPVPPIPEDNPMLPYEKTMRGLDKVMELAEKHHIYIIPVVMTVVGRRLDVMFQKRDEDGVYANIADIWTYVAKRHGGNKWLLAYDIFNEPNGVDCNLWTEKVAIEVIAKIRAVDKETHIVYEPAPWALPDQSFGSLKPIDDPKIVYSFHFYYPHTYTHQGIANYSGDEYKGKAYPGDLKLFPSDKAKFWDKAALEKSMNNVIAFQQRYGVKIYVGEFGVIRWAPGAAKWLDDTISIFEKHGWDWTFHSYGEWNGWNPTYAPEDPQSLTIDGGKTTDCLKVLLDNWRLNKSF